MSDYEEDLIDEFDDYPPKKPVQQNNNRMNDDDDFEDDLIDDTNSYKETNQKHSPENKRASPGNEYDKDSAELFPQDNDLDYESELEEKPDRKVEQKEPINGKKEEKTAPQSFSDNFECISEHESVMEAPTKRQTAPNNFSKIPPQETKVPPAKPIVTKDPAVQQVNNAKTRKTQPSLSKIKKPTQVHETRPVVPSVGLKNSRVIATKSKTKVKAVSSRPAKPQSLHVLKLENTNNVIKRSINANSTNKQAADGDYVPTLADMMAENSKLLDDLQKVNEHLTHLIDQQGYKNLLNQARQKKIEFRNRPASIKAKTYQNEILNNEKIIITLKNELYQCNQALEKLQSVDLGIQITTQTEEQKAMIKNIKNDIYHLNLNNKKNDKLIATKENNPKPSDFKQVVREIEIYNKKNEDLKMQLAKLESMENEIRNQQNRCQKEGTELKHQNVNEMIDEAENPLFAEYKKKQEQLEKWKKHMELMERNIMQKLDFLENDYMLVQQQYDQIFEQNQTQEKILQKQRHILNGGYIGDIDNGFMMNNKENSIANLIKEVELNVKSNKPKKLPPRFLMKKKGQQSVYGQNDAASQVSNFNVPKSFNSPMKHNQENADASNKKVYPTTTHNHIDRKNSLKQIKVEPRVSNSIEPKHDVSKELAKERRDEGPSNFGIDGNIAPVNPAIHSKPFGKGVFAKKQTITQNHPEPEPLTLPDIMPAKITKEPIAPKPKPEPEVSELDFDQRDVLPKIGNHPVTVQPKPVPQVIETKPQVTVVQKKSLEEAKPIKTEIDEEDFDFMMNTKEKEAKKESNPEPKPQPKKNAFDFDFEDKHDSDEEKLFKFPSKTKENSKPQPVHNDEDDFDFLG